MLVTPSVLTEFLSGEYEKAVIFAASKGSSGGYIQSVRKYTVPFNPNTPAQQNVRTGFKKSADFFKNATDKTIGAASFVRADFLEQVKTVAKSLAYRGIPQSGSTAGRQTFIMGAMVSMSEAAIWTWFDTLPQDCTTEGQLEDVLQNITTALAACANRAQRQRIGYVG